VYTPEFWINPEIYFNYQGYPFFTSIFAKCRSFDETQRTTPCHYVSLFKQNGTAINYVAGNFTEKGYNIIENLLEHKTEASNFLNEKNNLVLSCIDECEQYIKKDRRDFLKVWGKIQETFSN
jgi:hypothetical protein